MFLDDPESVARIIERPELRFVGIERGDRARWIRTFQIRSLLGSGGQSLNVLA